MKQNNNNVVSITTRMVRKDFKKWCRLCYKGLDVKVAFYKCFLVSTYYNSIFKKGVITRENFNTLLDKISMLPVSLQYTYYENEFLDIISWFNSTYVNKSVDNTKKTD